MADESFQSNVKPDYLTLGYYGLNKLSSLIPTKRAPDYKFNPLKLKTRPVTLQNFDRERNDLASLNRNVNRTRGSSLSEDIINKMSGNSIYNDSVVKLGALREQSRLAELNRVDQASNQEEIYNTQAKQYVDNLNTQRRQQASDQMAAAKGNQSAIADQGILGSINAYRQGVASQENAYSTLKAQDRTLKVSSILSQLQNPNLPIDSPERAKLNTELKELLNYSPAEEYKNSLRKAKGGKITFKDMVKC